MEEKKIKGRKRHIVVDIMGNLLPKTPGSHRHFHHPVKPGKVTVAEHKGRDIDLNTLKSIEKQSGLKLR